MREEKSRVKYLSLDVGGTKIELAKFDENYQLAEEVIFLTQELKSGSLSFIKSIEKIIARNLEQSIERIGISFKCIANDGVIVASSLLGGEVNFPLEQKFSQSFGLPVKLENDVNSMAIAESRFGKGQGVENFVLLNLGTGIRMACFSNGKLSRGFNGNAGEIGQKKIVVSEWRNSISTIEQVISGNGLSEIYFRDSGIRKSAKEIFGSFFTDIRAKEAIFMFSKYLGEILSDICYFYNPEIIILNGSLKKSAEFFLSDAVSRHIEGMMDFFQAKRITISGLHHGACLGVL